MSDDMQGRQRNLKRLWLALAVLGVVLAVLLVPPLVSVSRYKSQITRLMAASLGRPVHLSSVSMRLLPRPGFVFTDLIVDEDPAYGAEPVLHANTVTASFRLLALWRGRLEISKISVDEASLNLVRSEAGRWNLDSLFRTAAATAQPGAGGNGLSRAVSLPFLVATNSRINIKNGAEKLPFSLLNTDLSFWQEEPGDWRVRLQGQPARTDLSQEGTDTGTVRLQASLRRAPELRRMPLHIDLEWRDAQVGQLTRLMIGTDPGWRGDLTGELHVDGTADEAQVKTRLRAAGVHRAEFAPVAPMDFDARCGFVYHFSERAVENLACDSPLGDGSVHVAGELPGNGEAPHISVELNRIPVQAGLDALRTVRSGLGPGLLAKGTVSGKITYAENAPDNSVQKKAPGQAITGKDLAGKATAGKQPAAAQGPITGSLTVEGFQLSGDGLSQPLQIAKLVLEPVAPTHGKLPGQTQPAALAATAAIPAGGSSPLTVVSRLTLYGYSVTVHGQASIARARELALVAGLKDAKALDALAGDPVAVDLSAEGPWMPAERIPFSELPQTGSGNAQAGPQPSTEEAARPAADNLSGTVTVRNANWKADYLVNHVEIAQATLHLGNGETRWDPIIFSYGPVKGTAILTLPAACDAPQTCLPSFQIQFDDLDAGTMQAAFLGAHERGTMLSTLIARLRPSSAPVWPRLEGVIKADSLILGPVTLHEATATLKVLPTGVEITGLDAGILGGSVHGGGTLRMPQTDQEKPSYTLEGQFEKLSPAAVGQLLGMRWQGGTFAADSKIELAGYTGKDLAASVKGTLHFEWRHGAVAGPAAQVPLARFDRWTADAAIGNGAITLGQSEVQQGSRKRVAEGVVTLSEPAKAAFTAPKEAQAKKR
jgi:hypothetical protein